MIEKFDSSTIEKSFQNWKVTEKRQKALQKQAAALLERMKEATDIQEYTSLRNKADVLHEEISKTVPEMVKGDVFKPWNQYVAKYNRNIKTMLKQYSALMDQAADLFYEIANNQAAALNAFTNVYLMAKELPDDGSEWDTLELMPVPTYGEFVTMTNKHSDERLWLDDAVMRQSGGKKKKDAEYPPVVQNAAHSAIMAKKSNARPVNLFSGMPNPGRKMKDNIVR